MLLSLTAAVPLALVVFGSPTTHEPLESFIDLHARQASEFSSRDGIVHESSELHSRDQSGASIGQLLAAAKWVTLSPTNQASEHSVTSLTQGTRKLPAKQSPAVFTAEGVTFGPGSLMSMIWDSNGRSHNLTLDGSICATSVLDNWEAPDGLVGAVMLEAAMSELGALNQKELYNYTSTTTKALSGRLNDTSRSLFCGAAPVQNCRGRCLTPSLDGSTGTEHHRAGHITTVLVRAAAVYLIAMAVEFLGEYATSNRASAAATYAVVPVLVVFLNDYIIYLQQRGTIGKVEAYFISLYTPIVEHLRGEAAREAHGSCVNLMDLNDAVLNLPNTGTTSESEIAWQDAVSEIQMTPRGDECV